MIIDGHAHSSGEFWEADGIVRLLDDLGVDKVVLCPGPINEQKKWPVPDLSRILGKRRISYLGNRLIRLAGKFVPEEHNLWKGNAYVAGLAARHPGRIIQAYWIDPTDARMRAGLEARLHEWGFKVLKIHQCFQRFSLGGPEIGELTRFAGDHGLPFFIHHYSRQDAAAIVALAERHPRTTFIVAHLLGLHVFVEAGKERLPNVFFDISPPNLIPPVFVETALRTFGAERVLMGSDTPYGKDNLRKNLERVRGLNISDDDKRKILGENLRQLLGLDAGEE